jgi:hypothetical protein
MCGENNKPPMPRPMPRPMPTQPASPEDVHAPWLLNLITNLAQKVNTNIVVKPMPNGSLMLTNVAEADLAKLSFLTNTDANNNFGRVTAMGVSIPGQNSPLPLKIPGFSQTMVKIFNSYDSQAFLADSKTFKPFVAPFTNPVTKSPMSVNLYIDYITAMLPNMPETGGKVKTYSIAFSAKNNKNNNLLGSSATFIT